jgi:hypothetical protein
LSFVVGDGYASGTDMVEVTVLLVVVVVVAVSGDNTDADTDRWCSSDRVIDAGATGESMPFDSRNALALAIADGSSPNALLLDDDDDQGDDGDASSEASSSCVSDGGWNVGDAGVVGAVGMLGFASVGGIAGERAINAEDALGIEYANADESSSAALMLLVLAVIALRGSSVRGLVRFEPLLGRSNNLSRSDRPYLLSSASTKPMSLREPRMLSIAPPHTNAPDRADVWQLEKFCTLNV